MCEAPLRFPRTVGALVVLGFLLFFFWACVALPEAARRVCRELSLGPAWHGMFCLAGWLTVALTLAAALRGLSGRPRRALAILLFILLPAWGSVLNAEMDELCRRECAADAYRALASPEIYGLLVLHAATAVGYAISRRRVTDLPAKVEPWIVALLLVGLLLHVALAIQLADLVVGLLLFPLTLPLITPFALIVVFWRELARRLRAAGERARSPASLGPGLLRSPLVLGAHALIQGLWLGHPSAALDVFARTCTHAFSALPLEVARSSCGHYLCTIAARGHPSLVRPERLGVRRGEIIVVNRQLAIANAFEELLHVRWPRFGRAARRGYDRLAIPICGWIKSRWLADVLYLAMKPAEWLFYVALLALDPQSPETRIDAMYR